MKIKRILSIVIIISFIVLITKPIFASSTSTEKTKIETFLKEEENLQFLNQNFNSVEEIELGDFIGSLGYWLARICPKTDAEDVFDTLGEKMGAYTKTEADKYLQEKLGITMDKLSDYEEYKKEHVLSSDKDVYYHVMKNGAPGFIIISSIDSITELDNNKLKIEYTYGDDYNFNNELNKCKGIVTLQKNNDTYKFVANKGQFNEFSSFKGIWQCYQGQSAEIPKAEIIVNNISDKLINFDLNIYKLTSFKNINATITNELRADFIASNDDGWTIEGFLINHSNSIGMYIAKSSSASLSEGTTFEFDTKAENSVLNSTSNNSSNDEENKTPNNSSNDEKNKTPTSTTDGKDATTSKGSLPQTGENLTIVCLISVCAMLAIIFIIKYRKSKQILK